MLSRILSLGLIAVICVICGSCIILPLPPHHKHHFVVPETAIRSLVPCQTQRADVLLQFGQPNRSYENDRFLAYLWYRYTGPVYLFPGFATPLYDERLSIHILILEFGPDKKLRRFKELVQRQEDLDAIYKVEKMQKELDDWMTEKSDHLCK